MGSIALRAMTLALVVTLPATMLADAQENEASDGASVDDLPCADGMRLPGVGPVCPREEGLYEVFDANGASLGFTHGADPIPDADAPVDPAAASDPHCVSGASGTPYARVIYARAWDDADGYATWLPKIREMTRIANGYIADAAAATSDGARLRVRCVSGLIAVDNVVLPTSRASADFSTVVSDLRTLGYTDALVKHWVFYDDTDVVDRCGCSGTGHRYNDDTRALTNLHNGYGTSLFAVTWGGEWPTTWLHELAHTMGAVQNSAPYSTGAGHCWDGRDIMCYNDGGPDGHRYTTGYCSTEVFDCGKNTYFHAHPSPGSYLATHWNLGDRLNRYITFARPLVDRLDCPARAAVGVSMSCVVRAVDDSSGVQYTVRWNDGWLTRMPGSGYVAPDVSYALSHTYTASGTYTVSATAVDSSGWSTYGTLARVVQVVSDATPPTVSVVKPQKGNLYRGCDTRAPWSTFDFAIMDRGCVQLTATDASGVARMDVYVLHDGGRTRVASDTQAPWNAEFTLPLKASDTPYLRLVAPERGARLQIEVTDTVGNVWSETSFFTRIDTTS